MKTLSSKSRKFGRSWNFQKKSSTTICITKVFKEHTRHRERYSTHPAKISVENIHPFKNVVSQSITSKILNLSLMFYSEITATNVKKCGYESVHFSSPIARNLTADVSIDSFNQVNLYFDHDPRGNWNMFDILISRYSRGWSGIWYSISKMLREPKLTWSRYPICLLQA